MRILITGANRGLGWEMARIFVGQGHQVWGTARQEVPEQLLSLKPAGVLQMDMADEESITVGVAQLRTHIEGLDLLINCAGIDARALGGADESRGPFDLDAAMFNGVMDVNVTGPMALTRESLPLLRAGTSPVIVNISSQLGSMEVAANMGSDTVYCVSKAALNMLSVKTAAALRGDGITVVAMHPGWVRTDMGGPGGALDPVESATAMAATIAALTPEDSGRFIRWDGTDHPW